MYLFQQDIVATGYVAILQPQNKLAWGQKGYTKDQRVLKWQEPGFSMMSIRF